MKYFINLTALIMGLTLSYSAISKYANITDQSNNGTIDRFYVGSDNACDFSTIQAGINAASSSQNSPEVLVADNKNYDENLVINTVNLLIDGSFANCADARNDIHGGNRAKLNGFPGTVFPTIRITGLFTLIKGIQLQNNNEGGIFADDTSVITIEDMLFFQLGDSAIKLDGIGQIDLRIKNSLFLLNTGRSGGAIKCFGADHSIQITEGSGFANNTATFTGGAIWLNQGCDLSMVNGSFQSNHSDVDGGAIFSFNSNIFLKNVFFNSNVADDTGGAIYALRTTINAENTRFINNQSVNFGGAISLKGGAEFTLNREIGSCLNTNMCNHFDNNKSNAGGALNIDDSGFAHITSTIFENNRADNGTALHMELNSSAKIEGSFFNHNGNQAANGFEDRNVINTNDESDITITYSTFADNKVLFSTFKQEDDSQLNIFSSIIYDADSGDVFERTNNTTLDTHCLIVHEVGSFDTNGAVVTVADPEFVDAVNGDYHIDAALSPAVDYCTDTLAMAEYQDIDFEDRGFDDETIPNNPSTNGAYDIGADETYDNDIIFKQNFED